MKKHDFNFDGGALLKRIGASFYACYLYYLNIDSNEKRWKEVSTDWRLLHTAESSNYVNLWLSRITAMEKIDTNNMNLSKEEVHEFANKLLQIKAPLRLK